MTRRIAVFTGTRADYGLLSRLMRLITDDPALDLPGSALLDTLLLPLSLLTALGVGFNASGGL